MRTNSNLLVKVILLLGGTLFALLFAELLTRALNLPSGYLAPLNIQNYQLSQDPIIGYEYKPNIDNANESNGVDRGFNTNSFGFRDREFIVDKPINTYRILILGDSTTAGNGVPELNKTYTKQLEQLLNQPQGTHKRYEVFNMGVGGYQTMQEIQTLNVKGLKFNPDLVIVTICLNDFNLHADGRVFQWLSKGRDNGKNRTALKMLLRSSRFADIIYHRLIHFTSRYVPKNKYDAWYSDTVLLGKTPVEAGLQYLSELQQKHGFSTLVFILPSFESDFDKYIRYDLHQQCFRATAGLPSIKIIDLLNDFSKIDNHALNFSFDGCHMNERGHSTMAQILFKYIYELN